MLFHKIFLVLPIVLILVNSCTNDPVNTRVKKNDPKELFLPYSNQTDLKNYFKNTFGREIDLETDTIFMIPLNSCDKCVDALMSTILKNEFNGCIVFGGDIKQTPIFNKKYQLLNDNFNCLIDQQSLMYRYNLKIAEPSLIISNKVCPLNYGNIPEMCSALHWKK